jgi:phosphoglycerol transferase
LAIATLLAGLVVLAWFPSLQLLEQPGADQVWERLGIAESCVSHPALLGWMGASGDAGGAGLFTLSFPGQLIQWLACQLSRFSPLNPLQTFMLLGQLLTLALAVISCRWIGMLPATSAITALMIVLSPSAFSRLGHPGLAVLLPVAPALAACVQLRRSMLSSSAIWRAFGLGALACALCMPFQDYYVVFALLILATCLGFQLLVESSSSLSLRRFRDAAQRGGLFMAGFLLLLILLYSPKLLAASADGLPSIWSTPRSAVEQFRYGLLPLTWFIPSPWVPGMVEAFGDAGINTGSESYFWSTGSLLIPVAWLTAIRRLAQPPLAVSPAPSVYGLQDADRRFLALLLLIVTALGLLCMTMGGLGTLFAVYVSPVLRSLNRFTVFVYGAAVLYLVAELDLWLRARAQTP